uniref:Uncharacterized protein n=1 Tax=Triticum urartu TaxID=4572 RepID=A0A8R7JXB2_TRIUA
MGRGGGVPGVSTVQPSRFPVDPSVSRRYRTLEAPLEDLLARLTPPPDPTADSSLRRRAASTPAISSGILDFSPVIGARRLM